MKKIILVLALAFITSINAQVYNINTFAGNGTSGYSGDGGAATSAQFNGISRIAVDPSGNVYITDGNNSCIRKISSSGIITTIAGNGTIGFSGDGGAATSAKLNQPSGVAIDASGNIYIADGGNSRIRKVNTSGIITTIAGNGTSGYSGDGGAATSAQLNVPTGLAVDVSGNIYIADGTNYRIRKVSTSGIITTFAGNGISGFSGDGGAATSAQLYSFSSDIAVDASGNVYIVDSGNNRVRKVNTSGIITTIAGSGTSGFSGDGGNAINAKLNMPQGITVDGSGNVYITDVGNIRVRKVNTSGIITTIVGNGTFGFSGDGGAATSAQLKNPYDVGIDASGNNIYIVDAGNLRIRNLYTSGVGIEKHSQSNEIKFYPNPVNEFLNMEFASNIDKLELSLINVLGEIVKTEKIENSLSKFQLDMKDLSKGIYFLKATYNNQTQIHKFILNNK